MAEGRRRNLYNGRSSKSKLFLVVSFIQFIDRKISWSRMISESLQNLVISQIQLACKALHHCYNVSSGI